LDSQIYGQRRGVADATTVFQSQNHPARHHRRAVYQSPLRVDGSLPPSPLVFIIVAALNGGLTRSGLILIKYGLDITDETQEDLFQQRIHDPRRRWKLSPMDLEARSRWVDYSISRI
jgi:hypothetical protein